MEKVARQKRVAKGCTILQFKCAVKAKAQALPALFTFKRGDETAQCFLFFFFDI